MRIGLALGIALVGCTVKGEVIDTAPVEDTEPEVVEEEEPEYEECVELSYEVLGPEEPVVGDTWIVWARCDGATLIGATVLRFDPSDFASLDENTATFLYAGTGTMKLRVGNQNFEQEVVVAEPDTGA